MGIKGLVCKLLPDWQVRLDEMEVKFDFNFKLIRAIFAAR